MTKITIIGGGIAGLTTALLLRKSFPRIQLKVIADKFTVETTSDGAAGIFRPSSLFSGPDPQTTKRWIVDSYNFYRGLLNTKETGVTEISGYLFSSVGPKSVRNEYLEELVKDYRIVSGEELKICGGDWKYGSYFTTLLIQSRSFLPWAMKRLSEDGVIFERRKINSFEELKGECDIVINCTGLGAKGLVVDNQLVPIRGQLFKMKAPWLDKFYYGDFDTYIIPIGGGMCKVGGSRHFQSYRTEPCRHDGEAILERAGEMLPKLKDSQVVSTWVGLRPHRYEVRVEPQIINGLQVIHNYGHGGYGITAAPGTAMEVVRCLRSLLPPSKL